MALVLTYYSDDRRGTPTSFAIQVSGQVVATPEIRRSEPPRFFDVEIPVPATLIAGKQTATVRFEAKEGSQIATVFGIRMIRADAPS